MVFLILEVFLIFLFQLCHFQVGGLRAIYPFSKGNSSNFDFVYCSSIALCCFVFFFLSVCKTVEGSKNLVVR